MILQKWIARLVGFATCSSPRGSRNGGRRRRRRPGAGAGRESEPRKSAAPGSEGATPLPDVVTVVNVLRTVDCVAVMMPWYWDSGQKWNSCCNN